MLSYYDLQHVIAQHKVDIDKVGLTLALEVNLHVHGTSHFIFVLFVRSWFDIFYSITGNYGIFGIRLT